MKAIILARVSTEEQMTEGQSIPAQLARAREYATRKSLDIKSEYQFNESSLKDQRVKFEKVVEEIRQAKEPVALIVETVDRLQRSFKESVALDEFRKAGKLEMHFIRENLIIHKDSNSSEIQRWDLAVFVAKSFVLQISDNVKRTNELKKKNGEWPGKAPVGYMNVENEHGSRDIMLDPVRSPYIQQVFEMYATGNYSLRQIAEKMSEAGLTSNTKNPRPLTISMLFNVVDNPFYYGMMRCKGELLPHKYPPLISRHVFEKVQSVRQGWHKKPFKYAAKPYVFRGMITCADCGCTITPETQKGKIYYRCTNYRKQHAKLLYVKEEELMEPIQKMLKQLQLDDKKKQELVEDLKAMHESKNEFLMSSLRALRKEYDQIEGRISKMTDDKYDGRITESLYDKKFKEYSERQQKILEEMNRYDQADKNYYITANTVLSLAQRAWDIFNRSEVAEKRQLLNFVLQNCTLKDKKLQYKLKTPFDTVLLASKCSDLLRIVEDVRTSIQRQTGYVYIPDLKNYPTSSLTIS